MQSLDLAQFKNKNILVLGAGLTGISCARFLQKNHIDFSMNDSRKTPVDVETFNDEFPKVKLLSGQWNTQSISNADIILVSPGIDLTQKTFTDNISNSCIVMGDVELYCLLTNTPILAVTGSNGKSTVVSLLAYLGNALGIKTQLGGNIGVPVLDIIDSSIDCLVLELSSFQLETLSSMNAMAASILNISDDHLDRHHTIENYTAIKHGIYSQCSSAVVNRDDNSTLLTSNNQISFISFGSDKPRIGHFGLDSENDITYLMYGENKLISLNSLPLAGIHNALNYLAALALGYKAGWDLPLMVKSLAGFNGLPHRCQRIESSDGISWINDSKATNVGATIAAISGLAQLLTQDQKLVLIAGGDGKGADFTPLQYELEKHVYQLYTLGKDGDVIGALLNNSISVSSIEEAVTRANEQVKSGDIVLLSPACASIDMFKNFAERGEVFSRAVQSLQGAAI